MTTKITSKLGDLKFKPVNVPSWRFWQPEIATDNAGVEYHKKGTYIYYKEGDGFKCLDCNGAVMAGIVHHPIHDGPFPMSGSGRVQKEQVPYCPNCEENPNSSGRPINSRNEPQLATL